MKTICFLFLSAALAQARQTQIADLIALNTVVSPTLDCDANHRTVNGIVLRLLGSEDTQPTEMELSTLDAIAKQCPLKGGDAVYVARSIVAYHTGNSYEQSVDCTEIEERGTGSYLGNTVKFFPNPTTGWLNWSTPFESAARIRVVDALGRVILERESPTNSADLSGLPNGLYYVQLVSTTGSLLGTGKVSVLNP